MDESLRPIARSSFARSFVAVSVPFAFVVVLAVALARSGHTLGDYILLVRNGDLSLSRQIAMWAAIILFTLIYVPGAIRALSRPVYISTMGDFLILPTDERIKISDIKEINVVKTFWHKVMRVQHDSTLSSVIVTFTAGGIDDIKHELARDPRLAAVLSA